MKDLILNEFVHYFVYFTWLSDRVHTRVQRSHSPSCVCVAHRTVATRRGMSVISYPHSTLMLI